MTPVIGIVSCGFLGNRQFVTQNYITAIERAGGCPLLIPCLDLNWTKNNPDCWKTDFLHEPLLCKENRQLLSSLASCCHGFLFCGGGDLTPWLLGQPPVCAEGETDLKTDIFQLIFLNYVLSLSKPLLALCRGMQVMNAARGGELLQDLSLRQEPVIHHMQHSRLRSDVCHTITIEKNSKLCSILGEHAAVNSFHHQAVLTPGKDLFISAKAPDGIPEALEMEGHPFALGLQWHPECMTGSLNMRKLFRIFVDAARQLV